MAMSISTALGTFSVWVSGRDAVTGALDPSCKAGEEGLGLSLPEDTTFHLPGTLGLAIKSQLFLASMLGGLLTQSPLAVLGFRCTTDSGKSHKPVSGSEI